MKFELYTKPNNTCGYCVKAKHLLNAKKLSYTEIVLDENNTKETIQKRIENLGLSVEVRTLPQIFYFDDAGREHYIGGCSDLERSSIILNI